MTTIFFLGVGHMGGGMAANLTKTGFDVLAYDINDDNLARAWRTAARRPSQPLPVPLRPMSS